MKLYLYDDKHGQLIADMEIGKITEREKELIERIISFLDDKEITTRYKRLALAKNAKIVYEEGFSNVEFDEEVI